MLRAGLRRKVRQPYRLVRAGSFPSCPYVTTGKGIGRGLMYGLDGTGLRFRGLGVTARHAAFGQLDCPFCVTSRGRAAGFGGGRVEMDR